MNTLQRDDKEENGKRGLLDESNSAVKTLRRDDEDDNGKRGLYDENESAIKTLRRGYVEQEQYLATCDDVGTSRNKRKRRTHDVSESAMNTLQIYDKDEDEDRDAARNSSNKRKRGNHDEKESAMRTLRINYNGGSFCDNHNVTRTSDKTNREGGLHDEESAMIQ